MSISPPASSAAMPGYTGKPAVILSVQKQPGADTTRLTPRSKRRLRELTAVACRRASQADEILFRQANFIETSIGNVEEVLVEAVVVVAVVLFLFL